MCLMKVRDWLVLLTMENYVDIFKERGYVTIEHCKQIISSDLIMLGIDDPTHRKLLLDGVQLLHNSQYPLTCKEHRQLHVIKPAQEKIAYNYKDICKHIHSDPPPGSNKQETMLLLPAVNDKNILKLNTYYSCVACPHLKFANLYELDQHIAFFQKSRDLTVSKPG